MKNTRINEYIKFGLVMALLYIAYDILGVGCPVKFLTGISCAGCGMTRAWICLLHLDLKGAFYYHPLFFLPIIYFFLFLIKDEISHKIFNCVIVIGIALFITIYIFRLLNPDDIVVNINFENGFIYKILQYGGL
ncbi:DUF2752 domain-containing protein [Clostridium frigidicarnis]|uniref:DUF2752 domain-containing protein n=1 Tax=Clostridium frigidicarnis TaxID=84698 RepID=A0A1I0XNS5_9CLOT|nr:DUF2752 domain-containing protein [Clostridium frigidicarnis]SFB02347.1 Protein of unknown function [Clostridium frigidicarnis]